ncbi:Formamidopyrimidine-DNA glycosylase [compost metagenome]
MLEIPEAITISRQINETLEGKKITKVIVAQHPHKFAWYYGDPQNYHDLLFGQVVERSAYYGGMVEIMAGDACILITEGINLRYYEDGIKLPAKHQLHIGFEDGSSIVATVQMYGGLLSYPHGSCDNSYYLIAKEKPHPLSDAFDEDYFYNMVSEHSSAGSLKALLATNQRIPGLGNGALQDILFNAKLHPKKKTETLTDSEIKNLFLAIKGTLADMTKQGGRETERDLFGRSGAYRTLVSKNTVDKPCAVCGEIVVKQAYLGGSIYFCPACQKL